MAERALFRLLSTILLALTLAGLSASASAASAVRRPLGTVAIRGAQPGSLAGWAVAAAGDVNGDGLGDVILGTPRRSVGGELAGGAYVVFGSRSARTVDLANLGSQGFQIAPPPDPDCGPASLCKLMGMLWGETVASAGDVNGDGLADVMLSTPGSASLLNSVAVVFGKRDSSPVDLAALGTNGYTITQSITGDGGFGYVMSPAGDFNGDGHGDQIFAHEPDFGEDEGGALVLYGSPGLAGQTADYDSLIAGGEGVKLGNAGASSETGLALASVGDMNRDGLSDVIVGAPLGPGGRAPGEAWVLFGGPGAGFPRGLSRGNGPSRPVGPYHGLKIVGETAGDQTGAAVGGGCDVNGDRIPDVVVGAADADHGGRDSGSAYVVYGRRKQTTIRLRQLGRGGFRIDGTRAHEHVGGSVALVRSRGGRCMVLVELGLGQPFGAKPGPRGPAYALAPRRPGSVTKLSRLGPRDVLVAGRRHGNGLFTTGVSGASPAGDFNGDRSTDVIVGDSAHDQVDVQLMP